MQFTDIMQMLTSVDVIRMMVVQATASDLRMVVDGIPQRTHPDPGKYAKAQ